MSAVEGKKVLLIANHGYANEIIEELNELGVVSFFINDKPKDSFINKALGRFKSKLYEKYILQKYYQRAIDGIKEESIDYILIIRGEYTPVVSIKYMKKVFPKSKMVLYMWDSLRNNNGISKKWKYFDKVWTFDRKDYLENKADLHFYPLFYCENRFPQNDLSFNEEYDLCFIGTGHQDRIKIIKELKRQCDENGLSFFSYIYIPHPLVYIYNKLFNKYFRKVKLSDVTFRRMPLDKVYEQFLKSKVIVDVESPTQTGLTMRTMEVVGLGKKLMTTNKDVVNYDFFEDNRFFVFDRNNPLLPPADFLMSKQRLVLPEIIDKYSLKKWLEHILID